MKVIRLFGILIAAILYTSAKLFLSLFLCAACLYLLPFLIITRHAHARAQAIFWLNVTLGWTGLVWLALLLYVWSETPGTHDVSVANDATFTLVNSKQEFSE